MWAVLSILAKITNLPSPIRRKSDQGKRGGLYVVGLIVGWLLFGSVAIAVDPRGLHHGAGVFLENAILAPLTALVIVALGVKYRKKAAREYPVDRKP